MRVRTVDHERDHADLLPRGPDDAQPRDGRERFGGVRQQLRLVRHDGVPVQRRDVVQRRREPDGARDVRRPCLEAGGRRSVGRRLEADRTDHVAAALVRRHRLEVLQSAVQQPHAGGAEDLVPGDRVEVAADLLDVHAQMRRRLRAVHEHGDAPRVRAGHDVLHGIHGAERVRNVRDREHTGAWAEQILERVQHQLAPPVHRNHAQPRPACLADELPRHDVRVVLDRRDKHLVTRPEPGPAEALCDEVHTLRRAPYVHDLARLGRVEEALPGDPCSLVEPGRALAQVVHAAVDVGVVLGVEAGDGVDHLPRLLRRGGVVEVHEGPAVGDGLAEQREVRPHAFDVERCARRGAEQGPPRRRHPARLAGAPSNRSRTMASSCARSSGTSIRSRISAPNP